MDIPDHLQHFFDIEAEVDKEQDKEQDNEEQEGFNDGFINNEELSCPAPQPYRAFEDENNSNAMDDFLAKISERSQSSRALPHISTDDTLDNLTRMPTIHDFPLWRVGCRPGIEEEAIYSLLVTVDERYRIRSATARGSKQGCIYVEGHMDTNVIQLLRHTPGVIHKQGDIQRQAVDFPDWTKMLDWATTPKKNFKPNQWVRVRSGAYKGGIGFVIGIEASGVELLLIPHLQADSMTLKRKRTPIPPVPVLLDHTGFEDAHYRHHFPNQFAEERGDIFTSNGLKFEYGLLRKSFPFASIEVDVLTMPTEQVKLFQLSRHPALKACRYPRPQEWVFEEGEQVVQVSSGRKGLVAAIAPNYLEVDFEGENDTGCCPWNDVRKVVEVGDFIIITSGVHQGKLGFVVLVMDDQVTWIDKTAKSSGLDNHIPTVEDCEVNINWVKVTTPDFQYASQSSGSKAQIPKDCHQFKGTRVIIRNGPDKGEICTVQSVLHGQPTNSTLRVVVIPTRYHPTRPNRVITIDYDNIVVASTKTKLLDSVPFSARLAKSVTEEQSIPEQASYGGATPMPKDFSLTPAWNPSSRTPITPSPSFDWDATTSIDTIPSSSVASTSHDIALQPPSHPFLDRRLLRANLKAIVNGNGYKDKEMVVTVVEIEGRLSIHHKHFNTSRFLEPDSVMPKHPSVTRDNGLLVVIKGDHCGKLVRRIHHWYIGGKDFVYLAVVQKVDGAADIILPERLELPPDCLCVGSETKEEKKLNDTLMNALREEARQAER